GSSRRRSPPPPAPPGSRSRPVEQGEHGVGHRVVDGLHVRHRLSARATERDRGVQDHRRQFVAMGEAGLLGRVSEVASLVGTALVVAQCVAGIHGSGIFYRVGVQNRRRFPRPGAQVVGGHESVLSIAARRYSGKMTFFCPTRFPPPTWMSEKSPDNLLTSVFGLTIVLNLNPPCNNSNRNIGCLWCTIVTHHISGARITGK